MNRTGLVITLAVAAVVGVIFGLRPDLDLKLAGLFFDPERGGFWRSYDPPYLRARDAATWLITLVAMPAVVALVFKEHWGRPRPIDVTEFGGTEHFRPWWDPRGDCPKNCSFVAGEPSGAFWTLAPAAVVPPQWRALAYGAALTFGAAVGVLRIVAGAHFFSDVVFAGVFSFLVIWLVHGLLYRWRGTRTSDAAVDGVLERMIISQRAALMRIRSGRRDPASTGTSDRQGKK
jgi:membrane-associated phospholipid phosphatase